MPSTILMCLALALIGNSVEGYTGPGSTPELKKIFLQRCNEYLSIPSHAPLVSKPPNCPYIWKTFNDTFAFKDPCKPGSYVAFVEATSGPMIPKNKALFWSRTPEIATKWASNGETMVVLANLLTGYLVKDELMWCGSLSTPDGIDYKNCPTQKECDPHGEFWRQASRMLARRTQGTATVLLHGSNEKDPYLPDSFFGTEELPYLDPDVVPELKAIIVHPKGMPRKQDCKGPAMVQLQKDVDAKHKGRIKFSCVDDPLEVQSYYEVGYSPKL